MLFSGDLAIEVLISSRSMVLPGLGSLLGQQMVIDNRGGAGGLIGAELAAKAVPDGYTLFFSSPGALVILPYLQKQVAYDTLRDFTPVTSVTFGPSMLVTHPSLQVKNLKDLVSLAKAKPRSLSYGSSGSGAPSSHLGMELLKVTTGVDIIHIPYKSMAPALVDVLGGQIQMAMPTINVTLQHTRAGRLRAIGVTSRERSAVLPDVVPFADQGFPDFDVRAWFGMTAPAQTPREIVERLRAETEKALKTPNVVEKFKPQGIEPMPLSPAEFDALIAKEISTNIALVKAAGLTFN